ncbi:MAG: hypothetical protein OEW35_16090 [Gammaproteobacteria bacterium]|nr:hypothetical protein [Gammaproteobacteria bacterium]MDH4256171.1 hypothetical protein [Gammaproteobacteria bacterium]MDH5311592.1 hypothetical protein [Gammaproteobacteria bacterium]
MSAERACRSLVAVLIGLAALTATADEEQPDIEFLEYLGSWEQDDAEWLLFDVSGETKDVDTPAAAEGEKEGASARAQDSTELKDES